MAPTPLSDTDRLAWLRLIRAEGIGPVTFHKLMQKFKTADKALEGAAALAKKSGRKKPFKAPSLAEAEAELEAATRIGARFIASCEADYPAPLKVIHDPPPLLCVLGHPHLFEKRTVAVIGARNASAAGRKLARQITEDLAAAGVVIASGLARGIDGVAHEAALKTGTIAVVAGGVDVIYPPEHDRLHAAIAAEGAVISERPVGYKPVARDFPRRNRLISGLSQGVLVAEAALKSGTLITARFAAEQGRDVFAIPGSPLDPRCQGTNQLIRDGAALAQSADDILSVLDQQINRLDEPSWDSGDYGDDGRDLSDADRKAAEEEILSLLSPSPVHRDVLARESGLPPGVLADVLLTLVLSGAAEEHPGGRFALALED